jgi:ubiquinone/menaquinone biosynthesis C-methylase UbiE
LNLYSRYALPRLINLACGLKPFMRQRAKVIPSASGQVLEIGIGSGLNVPFYDAGKVQRLWGLDPSPETWALASGEVRNAPFPVAFLSAGAEAIPLDASSVDTIVITYSLCSIPDATAALAEMRRVLRPGGRLLFVEHGLAPDESVRKWQRRITPLWKKVAGGCHLDRDIPGLLRECGFRIAELETMYLPGWRPATFNYWGAAE